jgi:hypothetical protein
MVEEEVKAWTRRMIDAGRSLSDIRLALKQRHFSEYQIKEVTNYVDEYIVSKRKVKVSVPERKQKISFDFFSPSIFVGFSLFTATILLSFIPDMIEYVVLISYSSVLAFVISLLLQKMFEFFDSASEELSKIFISTFVIILFSKMISGWISGGFLTSLFIYLFVVFILSFLFSKGDVHNALLRIFIILVCLFFIDFLVFNLLRSFSFDYLVYLKKVLVLFV